MLDFQKKAQELLDIVGIKINGDKPWDIKVHNEKAYERVLKGGTLAFGETYMDGWWSADRLDLMFEKVFQSDLEDKINKFTMLPFVLKSVLLNMQKGEKAEKVAKQHYDIGNELYTKMLDKRLAYSCAMWDKFCDLPPAKNLDEAQEHKLDMICKKTGLKKGDRILDIGCGWGSFIFYAAEKYGAECVGITLSKEQYEYVKSHKGDLSVEVYLKDYRDINEKFDHIISIGMFEHVGYKNYRQYMKIVDKNLKKDGFFLLHTIGTNITSKVNDPWIDKYIFPNSKLPSPTQITDASEDVLIIEDWHNIGMNYYYTLMEWYKRFKEAWPELKERYPQKYDDRFYRMWEFYLLSSAARFKTRRAQVWQIVFSKKNRGKGYVRPC